MLVLKLLLLEGVCGVRVLICEMFRASKYENTVDYDMLHAVL